MNDLDTRSLALLICSFTVSISTVIVLALCAYRRYHIWKSKDVGGKDLPNKAIYRKRMTDESLESSQPSQAVSKQPQARTTFLIKREDDSMVLSRELQSKADSVYRNCRARKRKDANRRGHKFKEKHRKRLELLMSGATHAIQSGEYYNQPDHITEYETSDLDIGIGGIYESLKNYSNDEHQPSVNLIELHQGQPSLWVPPPPPDPPNPN